MANGWDVTWLGTPLKDKLAEVARVSIDETMGACVPLAKAATPVRTGTAQGSIMFQPSKRVSKRRVVGRWGSFDVRYFIWLEIGARGRPGRSMLRQAADKEYPKLEPRMRVNFKKMS